MSAELRHAALFSREPALDGDGWIGSWSPGIGDPTPIGWLSVGFYFMAAFQCFRLARGKNVTLARREALCWSVLWIGLVGLGINKQLDLQSALTEFGRLLAHEQGWYEARHEFQKAFVVQLALLLGVGLLVLGWVVREAPKATRVALLGALLLSAFVAIRATSFHHVDLFINRSVLGLRANWILELGGILLVMVAAWARANPGRLHRMTRRVKS